MKNKSKRLAVLERTLRVNAEEEHWLSRLRAIFGLTPKQVEELRVAPAWQIEALMARIEGREPSGEGLHAAWKACGCLPCAETRKIIGYAAGACPVCGIASHPDGSRPHDSRRWINGRLETFAEAGEGPGRR